MRRRRGAGRSIHEKLGDSRDCVPDVGVGEVAEKSNDHLGIGIDEQGRPSSDRRAPMGKRVAPTGVLAHAPAEAVFRGLARRGPLRSGEEPERGGFEENLFLIYTTNSD